MKARASVIATAQTGPLLERFVQAGRSALLAVFVLVAGCAKAPAGPGGAPAGRSAPAPVMVATATQRDVPAQIKAIARVEAYQAVTVKPQVAGQISAIHFVEGQDVKAGDLLVSIDPRPFQAALEQAEANLARDTALANDADKEARWMADLVQQTAAAQREYERAQAAADSQNAAVLADDALVRQARLDLEYCSIRSPLDGCTGERLADAGNVVKANEAPLVTINRVRPIYVAFSVPEQHVSTIRESQAMGPLAVTATIPQSDGPAEHGELSFVDNKIDNTTGMILLKASFANDGQRLWPGQFVNVALTLAIRSGAVVVPTQAVQTGPAGQYVYVLRDDQSVESRPVTTGPAVDGQVVIERGVDDGDVVVTDGHLRLVDGAKVEVKLSPASQPESRP